MKGKLINTRKPPGPDGLPNWVLRDLCDKLSGPVCAIFNASVREGYMPPCWKEANVIPVPKVHPLRSIQSDLRPISLTPTLGKIRVFHWFVDLGAHRGSAALPPVWCTSRSVNNPCLGGCSASLAQCGGQRPISSNCLHRLCQSL